jgi:uncharacterized protein
MKRTAIVLCILFPLAAQAAGPSLDCTKPATGSIDEMVCKDAGLGALDGKMADVYAAAVKKAESEKPPRLEAEQKGWVQGRDACIKEHDTKGCVEDEYTLRIAELQSRYALVPQTGPFRYACDGEPASEVVATFFATEPATVVAERAGSTSLLFLGKKLGGVAVYFGENESLADSADEITIVRGHGSPNLRCKKKPNL